MEYTNRPALRGEQHLTPSQRVTIEDVINIILVGQAIIRHKRAGPDYELFGYVVPQVIQRARDLNDTRYGWSGDQHDDLVLVIIVNGVASMYLRPTALGYYPDQVMRLMENVNNRYRMNSPITSACVTLALMLHANQKEYKLETARVKPTSTGQRAAIRRNSSIGYCAGIDDGTAVLGFKGFRMRGRKRVLRRRNHRPRRALSGGADRKEPQRGHTWGIKTGGGMSWISLRKSSNEYGDEGAGWDQGAREYSTANLCSMNADKMQKCSLSRGVVDTQPEVVGCISEMDKAGCGGGAT
ncbi:uncharacterized protein BCR38DRAFT_415118 [Pseudomassariella vexata]|uniref:Uncharacterized protein n=1 Tax=Pseudomassariella vexata TaxID=1141098 RepID=A0A1Y2D7A8_9PEZI|nr:uncharacterized protein BCR38DRAFT_415118 [Pseudomassariella vexata]ORY54966.1 hypothetical protein BCR38DRAFT_415118 [Pseudomassariella vexata]